ncbi:uncharacterized protein LOC115996106 [Ipomoea triloba]|uniref:uncharacterized protein LOC115996106 n=1 Tax=Ipomoea triloba TaxID=35885 RepID=UPI00125CDF9E|nr:uncharacterized protein LOC115996106 [Ipomoea triloba]
MAICRWIGYPKLFITFTCNPKWHEIQRYIEVRGLQTEDRPDIIDKDYYKAVEEFMVHGPCGVARSNSPCMVNGRCTKYFPKRFVDSSSFDADGYPIYRRRDDGRTITKNGIQMDNRYVVPHNGYLLLRYKAHLNVEWCNQSRSIKYLFKYINKGNDRVTAEFYRSSTEVNGVEVVDEINMYYDCRYVSASEATWRLLSYDIQCRTPTVERLSFHLPDSQTVYFEDDEDVETILNRQTLGQSMFTEWFEANKKYSEVRLLSYIEMPNKFVWKKNVRQWQPRQGGFSIGRIFYVPPGTGELYYLHCLLNIVRGPQSFQDIKTYNGKEYNTFKDACYAHGLLDDDLEYIDAIKEASQWSTAHSLRKLFVTLLMANTMGRPEYVWNEVWTYMAEDAQYNRRKVLNDQDLFLNDQEKKDFALLQLEKLLLLYNKSLKDFPDMPLVSEELSVRTDNRLILEELSYDRDLLAKESQLLHSQLTDEQRSIYDVVISNVYSNKGGLYFVYGYGGTGKTFLWRALSAYIRAKGQIVINVASSGIASLLLPGGRTSHSRFAIPISINEESTCNIHQGSQLADLIVAAKLIIWDEAPMMHKHCFEALDRTMRDILRFVNQDSGHRTFAGKTVVFGGDFRQILPVVPKGSRQDIVSSAINSSYLWKHCKVMRLTKNLRLNSMQPGLDQQRMEEFANWLASIGDGTIGEDNDGYAEVDIPSQMLLKSNGDPIAIIVNSTFPQFNDGISDGSCFHSSAILAPTLQVVNEVNEYMSDLTIGEGKTYYSSDTACKTDGSSTVLADVHTPEFLNTIRASGLPNHALTLKVGSPVMLMRNIDHSLGLCNGTRLVVTRLAEHVVEGSILAGPNAGTRVLIARMTITPPDTRLPFKFNRRQFPLMLSYAMTINKSQGQTLSNVGLILRKPVFVHGQLYVAASRISQPNGLKIKICDDSKSTLNSTTNIGRRGTVNSICSSAFSSFNWD